MNTKTRIIVVAASAAVAAGTVALTPAIASTATSLPGSVSVYQAKVVNQDVVLGPQSDPSTLTKTRLLPKGTYLITAAVGAVIASHDQIVCAANINGGNDGVFGTAGNPGTGGIYGTATMTDTVTVNGRQAIGVTCNSFNYGNGTYATSAVVEAVPVVAVH